MKIIQIMDNLNTAGGVNSFVYDLCIALHEAGHDVALVGIIGNKEAVNTQAVSVRRAGISVYCLCMNNKKQAILIGIPKMRQLIREISKGQQTICNLHLKLSVLLGGMATLGLKNIRCVETYHNTYHNYLFEYIIMRSRIKKYITVSETAKQEMFDRFHAPKNKVVAAPNGVDRNKIRNMVQRYGHDGNFISVVSVGRMSYEKNFITSVRAMASICNAKIHYTIIGDGPQMKDVVNAASGNKYIVFTGSLPRQKVLEALASSDVIIMPSLWEGRSILQLEAMAFDLPMILSDVPGLREPFGEKELEAKEIYRKCSFGFLVKTNEIDSYRKAVLDFVNYTSYIEEFRSTVQKASCSSDISEMVKIYESVYDSVL